ncbi:ABC transporter permease [Lysobacter humi (ex Lee et al. 2017)]
MSLFAHLAASLRRPDHWIYASWLDTVSRYRRNRLGLLWLFVPTAVYIWGIGGFMGAMQPGFDLPRFYAHIGLGFAVFRLASTVFTDATSVFSASQAYIYDGSLRLTDFLLRSLGRSVYYFVLTLPIVAIVVLGSPDFTWAGVAPAALGLAVVLVNLVFLSVLLGLLGARLPDLHELTGSAMLALFLFTPIVWLPDAAPEGTLRGALMRANPLFHMVEAVRAPVLGQPIEMLTYAYLGALTLGAVVLSTVLYGRFARRVPVWL